MTDFELNLIPLAAVCLGLAIGMARRSSFWRIRASAWVALVFVFLAGGTLFRALTLTPVHVLRLIVALLFALTATVIWLKRRRLLG